MRSEDFITRREHTKKSLPVGGGWVEGDVKTITGRKHKKSLPVGGEWVEGRVRTLLLGESTQKNHCRWEGGEWKEKWRLLLGGCTQKITAGGSGVSGRRSEDFITGREHKKSLPVGGEWVEGRVKTLLQGGSTRNCWWYGGEWRKARLYFREGAQKLTAGAMGVGVREKVWRLWHRQVAPKQKYKNT